MNELQNYRRTLPDVSYEVATIRAELKFRKFMRAFKAAFNPDQPRDEDGRWTDSGSTSPKADSDPAADSARGDQDGARMTPLDIIAARRHSALQNVKRDINAIHFTAPWSDYPAVIGKLHNAMPPAWAAHRFHHSTTEANNDYCPQIIEACR